MIPDLITKEGTASEVAALVTTHASGFVCIMNHVGGEVFAVRVVGALRPV